jgi:hypothetical protein
LDEPTLLFFSVDAVEHDVGFSSLHPRDFDDWRIEDVALLPDSVRHYYNQPDLSPRLVLPGAAQTDLHPGGAAPVIKGAGKVVDRPTVTTDQRIYLGQVTAMLQSEVLIQEVVRDSSCPPLYSGASKV